ncbi:1D-myo-inositol 2-acetamido-2-deoxy-alpha-D-glucopyranoside deacetylase [Clostridiales bacterium CHKCI001]|nr:1D-myo-inositol 2-acetamido-2-deoxy-alpha-D-glucopyranoside deacetylase [Clostridiales bacterium CHKCI001]
MSGLIFLEKNTEFHFLPLRRIQSKLHFTHFFGLLVILFFCFVSNDTVSAETAANLKPTITLSTGEDSTALNDVNYASSFEFKAQTTITLQAASPIYGVYLYWDRPSSGWTLQSGNSVVTYGQYEMLHEYVKVDHPSNTVTITIPDNGAILCEIQAFGYGDLPSDIQTWLPPCEQADILLFPTHAGDESLVFGGTIPYYAGEMGRNVQVAYLVKHYPDESYREHEKLNALWAMGLRNYPVMGTFEDTFTSGHVTDSARYDYDAVLEYVVTQIRRFKPLVVLGHDLNGEYGHGLHVVGAKAVSQSMNFSKDSTYNIASVDQYGVWEQDKTYLHSYKVNSIHMNWNIALTKFNGKTALQLADEGFKLNDSQQWTGFQVSDTGLYNCADFGLYLSSVGPDKKGGDFMENITPYAERINANSNANESTSASEPSSTVSSESSAPTDSATSQSTSVSESTETSTSGRLQSFEQSYLEIEPLALKVGGICIVLVAIGSFISLFIKKKN